LHEKGGKFHEVPAHHNAEVYVDAYIAAAGIAEQKKGPLFRSVDRHRNLTLNGITRTDVLRMVKRRATAAGLFHLLPHISGDRHHRLFGKRRYHRERPGYRRARVTADD
jgi:hypothetical protein